MLQHGIVTIRWGERGQHPGRLEKYCRSILNYLNRKSIINLFVKGRLISNNPFNAQFQLVAELVSSNKCGTRSGSVSSLKIKIKRFIFWCLLITPIH